ncbi:MAG: efflux RND transporter periplasmic adaptor subunit [Steroidobacteraceae bacterium]
MVAELRIPLIFALLLKWLLCWDIADAAEPAPGPAVPVVVATAHVEDEVPRAFAPGTIVSRADARLSAEVAGPIRWIAEPGAEVAGGDVIARLDTARIVLSVRDNEAAVKRLDANVALLRTQRDRLRTLAAQNIASRNQIDEAESRLAMAEQELEQARVARDRARLELARATVRAPFAGQVAERLRTTGEFVAVGDPLVRLVDTRSVEAVARAPLAAAASLARGQSVRVLDDAREANSRIRSLVPVGDERSRMLEVRVALAPDTWPIGAAVRVELPNGPARRAITVPRDAVVLRQGAAYVFRVGAGDKAERISVRPGTGRRDLVEVAGDLAPGDRIVVRGAERLQPGQRVTIQRGDGDVLAERKGPSSRAS